MKEKSLHDKFLAVLEMHMGIIYKISHAYCKDAEDRKDLIQEIIAQVWKSFPQYNIAYKLSTWIYRISLNTAISLYRKEYRRKSSLALEDAAGVHPNLIITGIETQAEEDENIRLLYQFISQLHVLEKALMILYLDGNTYAEIAEVLGITETNVATKLSRIKQKLKVKFATLNSL